LEVSWDVGKRKSPLIGYSPSGLIWDWAETQRWIGRSRREEDYPNKGAYSCFDARSASYTLMQNKFIDAGQQLTYQEAGQYLKEGRHK
jgi:hypothetical protein